LRGRIGATPPPPKAATPKSATHNAEQGLAAFQLGVSLYRKAEYGKAAGLFHTAFGLDPKPVYLFNAARSEHKGGFLDDALRDYDRCTKVAGADAKVVAKAAELARGIRAERKKKAAAEQALRDQKAAALKKAAEAHAWRTPTGWAGVGVGALLIGVGSWMILSASSERDDLNKKLDNKDKDGLYVDIDYETYDSQMNDLDQRSAIGVTAAVGGLAVAGVGAWLAFSTPDAPAVALTPAWNGRGLRLSLRF